MALTFRPARDEDQPGVRALFARSFGPRDEAEWRWRYRHPQSCAIVAIEDGAVVGHMGGLPFTLQHDGERWAGVQHVDLMACAEAARRHRLLGRDVLVEFSRQLAPGRFELSLSFPARGVIRRHLRHIGYDEIAQLGWHSRALDGPLTPTAPGLALEPLERFGPWADALWARWAPGRTASVRDEATLNARFIDTPTPRYRAWRLRDRWTGADRGWAVHREQEGDWELIELVTLDPWRAPLLAALERAARAAGARRLRLRTLPDSELGRGLLALEYRYEQDQLSPVLQRYSPYLQLPDPARCWTLLTGDSDQV